MPSRGTWRIPDGAWKHATALVLQRANGKCEKCGLPIEYVRSSLGRTDKPMWTIHHIVPCRELSERARDLCRVLSGKAYQKCIRMTYVKLATDPEDLELRCHRKKCRDH